MNETVEQSRRLRILHCTQSLATGGRLQAILNLVRNSDMRNAAELHLATLAVGDEIPEAAKIAESVTVIGRKSLLDFSAIARLRQLIIDQQIDLVHVHDAASQIAAAMALRGLSCPLVLTFHRSSDIDSKPWPVRLLCFPANLRTNTVITLSEERARHYRHYHFGVGDRVRVVHHGIDVDRFKPSTNLRTQVRRKLGVSDQAILLGTIGHFGTEKGVDLAVSAALKAMSEMPDRDIHHVVLGTGSSLQTSELKSLADGSGFADRMHWLGYQTQPEVFLAGFDLFLHGARLEAFGLVLAEALACGCPVVSTRCGGAVEIVVDGQCGRLIDLDDVDAMTAAIVELINHESLITEYRLEARAHALNSFSASASVAKHLRLYKSVSAG